MTNLIRLNATHYRMGDYDILDTHNGWRVFLVFTGEFVSHHDTKKQAVTAVRQLINKGN